jgi:hypothetical protein
VLNLASNSLGEIVLAAGWRSKDDDDRAPWVGPEGQEQDEKPGKPEGIIAIANAIPDIGAMTSLDVSSNNLGTLVLPVGWEADKSASSWDKRKWIYKHTDGREQKDDPSKPEGIIAIANAMPDMGALSTLVMRENNIHGAEAGKAFADMLAQNTILKELDLSSQNVGYGGRALDAAFAKEFAVGISDNGALSALSLKSNDLLNKESGKILADALKGNSILTELDISSNYCHYNSSSKDRPGFAQELAVGIRDSGAMSSFTFNGDHSTYPVTMDTSMTEADFSGKGLGLSGAIMLSAFIPKCM